MSDQPLAVITGAGRGIGRAIADVFAASGIRVTLCARTLSEVESVAENIRLSGGEAFALRCDVSSAESVRALHAEISSTVGLASILVNNAGIATSAKLEATSDELWEQTIGVNLRGPFLMTRAFVPDMRTLGGGRIISIASTAALEGFPYTSAYTASKHGLLGLTRALAIELQRSNISANVLCPGFVRTSILEDSIRNIVARTGKSEESAEQDLARLNKEGRLIEPIEVAEAALKLLLLPKETTGLAFDLDGNVLA
ncbi:MAG: SDR family oxidoreductase [Candidatus Kapaibacterium sp.]|jgi:NAD(P)-dependent dehydrogenase (short-subunit alcohol dehydrogenase family)